MFTSASVQPVVLGQSHGKISTAANMSSIRSWLNTLLNAKIPETVQREASHVTQCSYTVQPISLVV